MHDVLKNLNGTPGIAGSLVVTPDGIVVASELSNELDEETTAAHLGNVVTQTVKLLETGAYRSMERMVLLASRGKIVIVNLDNCLLVVVTNQFTNLSSTLLEIRSASKRIREAGSLSVRK